MSSDGLAPLPERITDWSTFRQLLLEMARHAVYRLEAVARLEFAPYVDSIEKAVVRAHMVRIYKSLDAYVALLEIGRTDSAPALGRTMMEAVINLEYLLNADDVAAVSRAFICRSVEFLLKPIDYFEGQVTVPENPDHPSDVEIEAFLKSIAPMVDLGVTASMIVQRAGLVESGQDARDFLQSSAGKAYLHAWPKSIAGRAQTDTARAIYNIWFANGSLTTHLNWSTLEQQDLWTHEDNAAKCENSILDERDVIEAPTWCINTALRFAHMFAGNEEASALERELQTLEDWFLAADQLKRSEFERQVDEPEDVANEENLEDEPGWPDDTA